MTEPSRANPWASLWLHPRVAIDAVLSRNRAATSLALAVASSVLGMILSIPKATDLLAHGWRAGPHLLALAGGALVGMIALAALVYYLDGWLINLVARLFGGKGTAAGTRAASAWSAVPLLAADLALIAAQAAIPRLTLDEILAVDIAEMVVSLWAFVLFVAMLAQVQAFGAVRAFFATLIGSLAPALIVALTIRGLLFQPFNIPSGSMMPTLLVGDYMFAAKAAYGYGPYSFGFGPLPIEGRLFGQAPKRGDVVVFRHEESDFVKRIVGLPGEKIQLRAGRLYIDGQIVERRRIEPDYVVEGAGKNLSAPLYEETLPGGATHRVLQLEGDEGRASNTEVFEVPAAAYFVLGDNRNNSMDSRFAEFGFVPFEALIGRAGLIYFSRGEDKALRTERMGSVVQ